MLRAFFRSPALQVSVLHGFAGLGFPLANLLLAGALAPQDYALIALVVSLINLSFPLSPLGLEKIVIRKKLKATPLLLARGTAASVLTATVTFFIGLFLYRLGIRELLFVWISVAAGGVAFLASAKFQSLERFAVSVVLAQSSCYFFLLAALVTVGFGIKDTIAPLAILVGGHVLTAILGWRKLLKEGSGEREKERGFSYAEALSLAGATGALQFMMQLERLIIPKVLSLEVLATFGVVAAIVIAPFRVLQMGAARTLFPQLRNAPDVEARRRLLVREGVVMAVVAAAICVVFWYVSPFAVRKLFKGKYELSSALVAAGLAAGLVRLANSFIMSAVTALCSAKELFHWNLLSWVFVILGGAAAVAGARWGLVGVVFGASAGWLGRIVLGAWLVKGHLSPGAGLPGPAPLDDLEETVM